MLVVCEQCHTKYVVPDEKVVKNVLRLPCQKCGHVITTRVEENAEKPRDTSSSTLGKWKSTSLNTPRKLQNEAPAWYYSYSGKSHGPFTEEELKTKLLDASMSQIATQCFIWRKSFTGWKPVLEVEPFASALLMPPPPTTTLTPNTPDENLPPLFAASPNASGASQPTTSKPDLAGLKHRLQNANTTGTMPATQRESLTKLANENNVFGKKENGAKIQNELPTYTQLPVIENFAQPNEEEETGDTTRIGTLSPLSSFTDLDAIVAKPSTDHSHELPVVQSKPQDNNDIPTRDNDPISLSPEQLSEIQGTDVLAQNNDSSSKPAPAPKTQNENKPVATFGGNSKPTPGISSLFGSKSTLPKTDRTAQAPKSDVLNSLTSTKTAGSTPSTVLPKTNRLPGASSTVLPSANRLPGASSAILPKTNKLPGASSTVLPSANRLPGASSAILPKTNKLQGTSSTVLPSASRLPSASSAILPKTNKLPGTSSTVLPSASRLPGAASQNTSNLPSSSSTDDKVQATPAAAAIDNMLDAKEDLGDILNSPKPAQDTAERDDSISSWLPSQSSLKPISNIDALINDISLAKDVIDCDSASDSLPNLEIGKYEASEGLPDINLDESGIGKSEASEDLPDINLDESGIGKPLSTADSSVLPDINLDESGIGKPLSNNSVPASTSDLLNTSSSKPEQTADNGISSFSPSFSKTPNITPLSNEAPKKPNLPLFELSKSKNTPPAFHQSSSSLPHIALNSSAAPGSSKDLASLPSIDLATSVPALNAVSRGNNSSSSLPSIDLATSVPALNAVSRGNNSGTNLPSIDLATSVPALNAVSREKMSVDEALESDVLADIDMDDDPDLHTQQNVNQTTKPADNSEEEEEHHVISTFEMLNSARKVSQASLSKVDKEDDIGAIDLDDDSSAYFSKPEIDSVVNDSNQPKKSGIVEFDSLFDDVPEPATQNVAKASHARLSLDEISEKHKALFEESEKLEQQHEDESSVSESSMLIQLNHFQKITEQDKRKSKVKVLAITIPVVIIFIILASGVWFVASDNDEEEVAQTGFSTVKGSEISSEDLEAIAPLDEFEIIDMSDMRPTPSTKPRKTSGSTATDKPADETASDKVQNLDEEQPEMAQNGATAQAADAIYGKQEAAAPKQPTVRHDGRAGVELNANTESFGSTAGISGSKYANKSSSRELFAIGLKRVSNSVKDCSRRVTNKGGSMPPKVIMSIVIQPEGNVSSYDIDSKVPDEFNKCLSGKHDTWKFTPFEGNEVKIKQSFIIG